MMSPATSLSVAGLSKAFGDSPVLDGLDLEVPTGSLTAVLGPSGCGKTTLLRLIAGFEHADAGTIRLGEQVVADRAHPPRRPSGAGSATSPRRARSSPTSTSPPTSASACRAPSAAAAGSRSCSSSSTSPASASACPAPALRRPAAARGAGAGAGARAGPGPARRALRRPRRRAARRQVRGEVRDALRGGRRHRAPRHPRPGRGALARRPVAVMRGGRIVQAGRPADALPRPGRRRGRRLRRRGGPARPGRQDGGDAETSLGRAADPGRRHSPRETGRP